MNLLSVHGISLFELLENPHFDLAGITVFGYGTDDFDSHPLVRLCIYGLDNLAKSSLTQKLDSTVCRRKQRDQWQMTTLLRRNSHRRAIISSGTMI